MPKEVCLSSGQTEAVNQNPSDENPNRLLYVGFLIARCPVCGVDLDSLPERDYIVGGHLWCSTAVSSLDRVLFRACTKHCEEARNTPVHIVNHEMPGYMGEWEPKWGITARVLRAGEGVKTVRIV